MKQQLMNYTQKNFRNLKDDAIPTLHLPCKKNKPVNTKRLLRVSKRRQLKEAEISQDLSMITENNILDDIITKGKENLLTEEVTK